MPPDIDRLPGGSTRQKHNAHGPEVIQIYYQFHPLYGQSLRVVRRMNSPRGEYIFCELPDGTIGGFPSWVADAVRGAAFTAGLPLVSAVALAELRALLDSLHSGSQRVNASLHEVRKECTNESSKDANNDADESAVL